jgi:hypothetical protein
MKTLKEWNKSPVGIGEGTGLMAQGARLVKEIFCFKDSMPCALGPAHSE